jgi:hypothetical protein
MSFSQSPALRATALQIAVALTRYERHVRRLAATWLDMELYTRVSEEFDEIRDLCAMLPSLAVPCATLLISHAELIHALWRRSQRDAGEALDATDAQSMFEEHLACIDWLARRSLRLAEEFTSRSPVSTVPGVRTA